MDSDIMMTEESELLEVSRNVFIEKIERAGFTLKKNKIPLLAEILFESKGRQGDTIYLKDIEDFALGYRQHANKVFAFG
jgi:hypothetical protein